MRGVKITISIAVALSFFGSSVLGEVRLKDVARVRDQRRFNLSAWDW